jgi:hypothetical protein
MLGFISQEGKIHDSHTRQGRASGPTAGRHGRVRRNLSRSLGKNVRRTKTIMQKPFENGSRSSDSRGRPRSNKLKISRGSLAARKLDQLKIPHSCGMKINLLESFARRVHARVLKMWPSRDEVLPCLGLTTGIIVGLCWLCVAARIC